MIRNESFSRDDNVVNVILKELSSCFEATYAEILANRTLQSSLRELKRVGEEQLLNGTEPILTAEESQRVKMTFAEIRDLTVIADELTDAIISEKFQSHKFRSTLKEEVLKIILNLHSDQDKSDLPLQGVAKSNGKNLENGKIVHDKLKDVNNCVKNVNDISKQASDRSFKKSVSENTEAVVSNFKKVNIEKIDNDSSELGNISFDSVSSVHTSDLSSFDDEISISSDEDTGLKRKRLSLKMVEEEVKQIRKKKKKNEKKNKQTKTSESDSQITANDSSITLQKPQRVRKPNSKYNEFTTDLSPIRTMSPEKASQNKNSTPAEESEVTNSLPRKRGRPRKIETI